MYLYALYHFSTTLSSDLTVIKVNGQFLIINRTLIKHLGPFLSMEGKFLPSERGPF